MQSVTKKRVGILRGGAGEHYASSLKRGGEIILHITENLGDKYKVVDILVDRDYIWHLNGVPIYPSDLAQKVDVVWNVAHPSFSNILESLSIPYVGHGSFSTTLESSRDLLAEHMKKINVPMPRHVVLPVYQKDFDGDINKYIIKKAKEIHAKFPAPWIVKSYTPDSNMGPVRGREGSQRPSASNGMGVHLAKTFPELIESIEDGVQHEQSILVEEFIPGKVASLHSVPGFRSGDLPALPHGREQAGDIYTFPLGNTFGDFSSEEKEKLAGLARDLHRHVGAKHYLKSDFVLSKWGKIYLLQIEGIPNLKPDSHFSQVCISVGTKPHYVIEHIIEQVLK